MKEYFINVLDTIFWNIMNMLTGIIFIPLISVFMIIVNTLSRAIGILLAPIDVDGVIANKISNLVMAKPLSKVASISLELDEEMLYESFKEDEE